MRVLLLQRAADNCCDLFLPDTSFGDGRTALHKAAAGGRPLAVHLLLAAHVARTTLGAALGARDARGQTPLQVATAQAEDPGSVARWDAVAGGTRADWAVCARLLRQAARDGSVSWSIDNNNDDKRNPPIPAAPERRLDDCGDCGDDGNCVTKSWEQAFQQGLQRSMNRNLSSSSAAAINVPQGLASLESNGNDKAQDSTIPLREEKKDTINEKDAVPTAPEIDSSSMLGRPCDACSKGSIYLYPDSGSLICQCCYDKMDKINC
jgi:hypothetical protein